MRVLRLFIAAVMTFMVPLSVLAAPVRFDVKVTPSPFKASEFADVTVKALDENGNVDATYNGDIWIEVEGFDYTDPDIVLPGNGIAFFEAADQGIKIFSKGLTIKKWGQFTLTVADVYDTTLKGSVKFEVLGSSPSAQTAGITVNSPASGSTETQDSINVVGTTTFPTTPITILLDGTSIEEGVTDAKGAFTVYLKGVSPGKHTLTVNALDLEDKVVGTSGPIPFTYEAQGSLFMWLDIEPTKEVMIGEKLTFTVHTAPSVTSAMLVFNGGEEVPTQKIEAGLFRKQMSFDQAGTLPIDVHLSVGATPTTYENVDAITITDELRKILTVDYTTDTSKNKVDMTWTYAGKIDYFKIKYGTNKDTMRLSLTTSEAKWSLILADAKAMYYAQVFPVDENGAVNGEPSAIIEIPPMQGVDANPICGNTKIETGEACDDGNTINGDGCSFSCMVEVVLPAICGNRIVESGEACDDGNVINNDGCSSTCALEQLAPEKPTCYPETIELTAKKMGDKYYLVWDPVEHADSYIVYRADQSVSSTSQMSIVATTKETMFEYPFDKMSKVDKWARYAVEAVCENNDQKQVGDMQKVKVGPEKTILLVLAFALLAVVGVRSWKNA
jgi:cysteine-rich repeat protein